MKKMRGFQEEWVRRRNIVCESKMEYVKFKKATKDLKFLTFYKDECERKMYETVMKNLMF